MICPLNVVIVNSYVQLPEGNLNLQYPPHLPLEPKPPPTKKNPCLGSGALPVHFTPFSLLSSDPDMEISSLLTPINIFWFADWTRFASLLLAMLFFTMSGIDFQICLNYILFCVYIIVTCSYLFSVVSIWLKAVSPCWTYCCCNGPNIIKYQLWLC